MYDKLIFYGLSFLTVAIPLVFLPANTPNYMLPKLTVVSLLVAMLLVLQAIKRLTEPSSAIYTGLIARLAGAYFTWAVISFFFSIDKLTAFYGHYLRHDGLIAYLVFGGLFLTSLKADWSRKRLETLMLILIYGGVFVSLLTIAQSFGWSVVYQPVAGRASATLGNPIFLATYLVIVFTLTLAMGLQRFGVPRGLMFGTAGLLLAATLLTGARSAVFALAVGTAVVFLYHRSRFLRGSPPRERQGNRFYRLSAAVAFLMVLATLLWTTEAGIALRRSLSAGRLRRAADIRLELAKAGMKVITDDPLTGAGPGNFAWAVQKAQSRRLVAMEGTDSRFDDAHDLWLQTGASLGLPALALMLIIVVLFLTNSWRLTGENGIFAGPAGAVAGFLTLATFEPAGIEGLVLFWLFLGIVAGQSSVRAKNRTGRSNLPDREIAGALRVARTGVFETGSKISLVSETIVMVVLAFLLGKASLADFYYGQGLDFKNQDRLAEAEQKFLAASRSAPQVDQYYLALSGVYERRVSLGDKKAVDPALYYLRRAVQTGGHDPDNWITLSAAYLYARSGREGKYGEAAAAAAGQALRLSPNYPPAHRAMGAVLLEQGKLNAALKHFREALAIDPSYAYGRLSLGRTYERLGRLRQAVEAYEAAAKSSETRAEALRRLEEIRR